MRYTECRLTRLATEMLRDIDADTVDFEPNYDESRREPTSCRARFPNLLLNGSAGIAVGMATNIPPHNLGEVVDALVAMIDEPTIDVDRLTKHIKGPDFPTGGIILGREGIREAYRSGRGRIVMRARAHIEELRGGRTAIVVNELPYGVKKGGDEGVIKKIADLVNDKVIPEVARRQGPLGQVGDADPDRAQARRDPAGRPEQDSSSTRRCRRPSATTPSRSSTACRGRCRCATLLQHYLDFQREVVTRRSKFELRKAEARAHVLAGLPDRARQPRRGHRADPRAPPTRMRRARGLMETLRALGDPGAGDPRPAPPARSPGSSASGSRTSTPTCRSGSPSCARSSATSRGSTALIREELLEIKQVYGKGDDRRTEIVAAEGELELEDLIAGGGHGDRDHALRLRQAATGHDLPRAAPRRHRRDGHGR